MPTRISLFLIVSQLKQSSAQVDIFYGLFPKHGFCLRWKNKLAGLQATLVWNYDWPSHLLTRVKCRATGEDKREEFKCKYIFEFTELHSFSGLAIDLLSLFSLLVIIKLQTWKMIAAKSTPNPLGGFIPRFKLATAPPWSKHIQLQHEGGGGTNAISEISFSLLFPHHSASEMRGGRMNRGIFNIRLNWLILVFIPPPCKDQLFSSIYPFTFYSVHHSLQLRVH